MLDCRWLGHATADAAPQMSIPHSSSSLNMVDFRLMALDTLPELHDESR
jgi:hypothetical protein